MYENIVIGLANEAVVTVLLISAPILGAGLIIGLLISILQATTQLQEMTLVFVPKIVVTLLVIVLFGPWMLNVMTGYMYELWVNIPNMISL